MGRNRLLLTAAASLAMAAATTGCATQTHGDAPPVVGAETVRIDAQSDASPYGLFLAGRGALNKGANAEAADYLDRAANADADAAPLRQQAFDAALFAGDIPKAALYAPQGEGVEPATRRLGLLVRGVDALASGKGDAAYGLLTVESMPYPHKVAADLLIPWAAAAAGRPDAGDTINDIDSDGVSRFFARLGRARILERTGKLPQAEALFRELIVSGDPNQLGSLALGSFLERRGRWQEAVQVYDAALGEAPSDTPLAEARERAAKHRVKPPMFTVRQGAAEALVAPAASLLVQRQNDLALVYLRLALRLDPTRADALSLVGDILASRGDPEGARAAWGQVPSNSAQYLPAQAKLGWSYFNAGDHGRGIAIARNLSALAPAGSPAPVTLAEMLREDQKYDEAAAVLDPLINGPGGMTQWRYLQLRATNLERAGRWTEAERDLKSALSVAPDEPELLTALAFGWIDRGEHLDEAMVMITRAAEISPRNPAVVDALGWGYYRTGDFAKAVETLEQAVLLDAASPVTNDHLGDAYWRVGRQVEAKFQWRRVLTLAPDAKTKAQAEAKLQSGLGPDAGPRSSATPAPS